MPDHHALAWWSMLGTIAAMIEARETSFSPELIEYLSTTLYDGMGSPQTFFSQSMVK